MWQKTSLCDILYVVSHKEESLMANKQDDRKTAIYARKSVYTGKGESINNQINTCKKKLKFAFPDIKDDDILVYKDEGFSGYTTKRPDFQRMIQDIKENRIKSIAFYKLDRISRNVSDFTSLMEELNEYDVSLMSATENIETVTPTGRAMLMMISVFAQLERDTIAERIRDNMMELAKFGRWLGGTSPAGYKSRQVEDINDGNGKKKRSFELEIVEEEARDIKLIFDKMLELESLTKLSDWCMSNGMKTRQGKFYSRFSLKAILANPVYAKADDYVLDYFTNPKDGSKGNVIYDRGRAFDGKYGLMVYNKNEKRGTRKIHRDMSEWIIAIGNHEGLISGRKWVAVQDILYRNNDMKYRKPTSTKALLSGMLRCKYCGALMRPKLRSGANLVDGERPFDYICELKDKSNKEHCQCPNLNGLMADRKMMEDIKKYTVPSAAFYESLKELSEEAFNEKEDEDKNKELESVVNNIKKNKKKISDLVESIPYVGLELYEEISKKVKQLKKENEELEVRRAELQPLAITHEDIEDQETATVIKNILDTYLDDFDDLSLYKKREILRILVSSVESDGKDLYVKYRGIRKITPTDDKHSGGLLSRQFPTRDGSKRGLFCAII